MLAHLLPWPSLLQHPALPLLVCGDDDRGTEARTGLLCIAFLGVLMLPTLLLPRRTMFAFEEWHSALEMKLYLHRFIHHFAGLADLSTLKFTKYNQYESLVLPLMRWPSPCSASSRATSRTFSTTAGASGGGGREDSHDAAPADTREGGVGAQNGPGRKPGELSATRRGE